MPNETSVLERHGSRQNEWKERWAYMAVNGELKNALHYVDTRWILCSGYEVYQRDIDDFM